MEKLINKFNITSHIKKGISRKSIQCPQCKADLEYIGINKLNYSKIQVLKCPKCKYAFQIGDVFNFIHGRKLNQPLNKDLNSTTITKNQWSSNYDKI